MSNRRLARAGALVLLSALAGIACSNTKEAGPRRSLTVPGDSAPSSAPPTTTTVTSVRGVDVVFAGGQVVGGPRKEAVRLGERVRIRVTSDVADEVHVHTYDLRAEVASQQPAEVEVSATIPGRHEVELEKNAKLLMTLEVR